MTAAIAMLLSSVPAYAGVAVAIAIGRNAKAKASTKVYRPRTSVVRARVVPKRVVQPRRVRRIKRSARRARKRVALGRRSIFAWHWVPGVGFHGKGMPRVTGISYGHLGTANHSVSGVDVGLFTYTHTTMSGLQVAQTGNWVGGRVGGVQLAGALNKAGALHGIQVAGGLNYAGVMKGWQVAGGANIGGRVSGVQMAPLNVAGKLRGVQLGVVNVVGTIEGGDAFGLFTFAGNGYNHLSLYSGGADNLNLALTFGGRHLYTILRAGVAAPEQSGDHGHDDPHIAFRVGMGWGWHQSFGSRWYVDVDNTVGVRGEEDCKCKDRVHVQFSNEARVLLGFAPWKRLSLFTGLAVETTWGSATVETTKNGKHAGDWRWDDRDIDDVNVSPRWVLGVRL